MAKKGVGAGSRGGGGKSKPGPRQPAGRKYGSAGPVKTGPRSSGPKTAGASRGGQSAGVSRGRSDAPAKRGAGRSSFDDRPPRRDAPGRPGGGGKTGAVRGDAPRAPRRGAESRPAWDKGPGRPARQGADTGRPGSAPRREGPRPERREAGSYDRPARREGAPLGRGESERGGYKGFRGEGPPGAGGRGYERKTGTGASARTPRQGRDETPRPPRRAPGPGAGRKEAPRPERRRPEAVETPVPKGRILDRKGVHGHDWQTQELEGKVVGLNPVLELLKAGGRAVDTVFVDSAKGGKIVSDIMAAAKGLGITIKFVPKEALDNMSPGIRHQGAVAVVSPKEYDDPDALVEAALASGRKALFVLLDGVEDPQNLGSVIRSADAAGADGVFIPEHRAAHLSAAVARASAGALEHVPVAKVGNMAAFIEGLKSNGVWVVAVEAGTGKSYTGFDMTVPVALVLGSEGAGVRAVVKGACDDVVSMPMLGKVNSLNVSVAAGIMLYEVIRQRAQKQA